MYTPFGYPGQPFMVVPPQTPPQTGTAALADLVASHKALGDYIKMIGEDEKKKQDEAKKKESEKKKKEGNQPMFSLRETFLIVMFISPFATVLSMWMLSAAAASIKYNLNHMLETLAK